MRNNKLDILTIQETHLTNEALIEIQNLFEKQLHIIGSTNPSSSNAAGIAIILNKATTKWKEAENVILIPGRAMQTTIPWGENNPIICTAVYAPNNPSENRTFWERIERKQMNIGRGKTNILIGDFNIVEDAIDRMPPHPDNATAIASLATLKRRSNLIDGWRGENPDRIAFTFRTDGGNSQSRLDRIYVKDSLLPYTLNWQIHQTGIRTDHKLITMDILNPWTPHIGKGRYAMPTKLLEDEDLLMKLEKLGNEHLNRIEDLQGERTQTTNPQIEHKKLKEDIIKMVRLFSKRKTSELQGKIDKIKKDLDSTLNAPSIMNEEERRNQAAILDEKMRELETIKLARNRDNNAARYELEGETISKYWIDLNKVRNPRDIMVSVKNPLDGKLERRSEKMAEITRDYHEQLQRKNLPPQTDTQRQKVEKTLSSLDKKISQEITDKLAAKIHEEEIDEAISELPSGKAAGLDGIPLELWRSLRDRHTANKDQKRVTFNVTRALGIVINDIEEFGVNEGMNFAEGWMCPIYKKGDKAEIGNYRPITVLNTDYKIYTKILSKKIEEAAPHIIHKDQAGFMKGRKITDQTELASLMIQWCEETETNGMIVCLDQEKAYDKITHEFLWASLRKNGFPESFIEKIKELYKEAYTIIIINGEKSTPYLVIRGVRQGDPMSCLLFNIAIESLAQSLRKSELQGIKTPGKDGIRIITTLFADDTTVYLAKRDPFHKLQEILDGWCEASGAKFNVPKSIVIPVGTENYRKKLIRTRKTHRRANAIPEEIHIAREGEPTRLLGAFIGNKINNANIWTPTVEKVQKALTRWGKSNPTIYGKRLIVNMVVGGLTQYKTAVQGMPEEVEKTIEKTIRDFMWGPETRAPISLETLYLPIEKGGIKLLNIKSRNEAIEIMKLQRYLKLDRDRPLWATIADDLIAKKTKERKQSVDGDAFTNTFLQKLNTNTRTINNGIHPSLRRMIKTAKKHEVRFHPLLITPKLRKKMPAWHHIGTTTEKRTRQNSPEAKCLREIHQVKTIKDLLKEAKMETENTGNHKRRKNCACNICKELRHKGCKNPRKCFKTAEQQLKTIHPFWNPVTKQRGRKIQRHERERSGEIRTFNPDITLRKNMANGFRVFCRTEQEPHKDTSNRLKGANNDNEETVTVYTDGSCKENGSSGAKAGAGIWFGHEDPRNRAIKIPKSLEQTNNVGEIIAILETTKIVRNETNLHIMTDSQLAMDALTTNLESNEERGWIGISNKEILSATVSALRRRDGTTTIEKVKGHSGNEGNNEADKLANEGADKDNEDEIIIYADHNLLKPGAQLSKATQALLYRGILERKLTPVRRGTRSTMRAIKTSAERTTGSKPSDEKIWKSIQNKDVPRKIRAFMWKCIHNANRVGEYWEHIPGYEERAMCPTCYTIESMEHILCECTQGPQKTIWELNSRLQEKLNITWQQPDLGTLLSSQLIETTNEDPQEENSRGGLKRLLRIITAESLYLIWILRCEWRIGRNADPDKIHTVQETSNRWRATILRRAKLDFLVTNKKRYGDKAKDRKTAEQTWKHISPDDSAGNPGLKRIKEVLAGIGIT